MSSFNFESRLDLYDQEEREKRADLCWKRYLKNNQKKLHKSFLKLLEDNKEEISKLLKDNKEKFSKLKKK